MNTEKMQTENELLEEYKPTSMYNAYKIGYKDGRAEVKKDWQNWDETHNKKTFWDKLWRVTPLIISLIALTSSIILFCQTI